MNIYKIIGIGLLLNLFITAAAYGQCRTTYYGHSYYYIPQRTYIVAEPVFVRPVVYSPYYARPCYPPAVYIRPIYTRPVYVPPVRSFNLRFSFGHNHSYYRQNYRGYRHHR